MNRFLKWVLICIGVLAALVIVVLLVLPSFYDIQSLKPRIEQAVQDKTGRDFAMGGDLELTFFPWAGVTLKDVRLGNPDGFKEKEFLSLSAFEVRMKLIPLLFKDLQVKHVVLKGLDLQLITAKSGRKNWDFDSKTPAGKTPAAAPTETDGAGGLPLSDLTVGEILVADSRAVWVDHASGLRKEITDVSFQVDGVSQEKPVRVSLSAKVDGKPISMDGSVGPIGSPPGTGTVKLDLTATAFDTLVLKIKGAIDNPVETPVFRLDVEVPEFSLRKALAAVDPAMVPKTTDETVLEKIAFQAKLNGDSNNLSISDGIAKLDDSTMTLQASVKGFDKPKIQWDFKLDQLDSDRYLPPSTEEEKKDGAKPATAPKGKPSAGSAPVTDYAPLRTLTVNGHVGIDMLMASGAKIENLDLKITGKNGIFKLDPCILDLYRGKVKANGVFNVQKAEPRSRVKLLANNVQAEPFLKDMIGKDIIVGTAKSEVSLSMAGDTPERIKRTLSGNGDISFKDGAIKGIDLVGMIQNAAAAFGLAEKQDAKAQTEFTELSSVFTIKSGLFQTTDTALSSAALKINATGTANLVKETLDFRVDPTYFNPIKLKSKDEAGPDETTAESAAKPAAEKVEEKPTGSKLVPVLITGSFSSPKFKPDLEGALKQTIESTLTDFFKKKEDKTDKTEGETEAEDKSESKDDSLKGLIKGLPFGK